MILPLTRELSKAVVLALDLAGFITAVILRCIQLWQALSHRTRSGAARCSALGFLTGCPPGGQGPLRRLDGRGWPVRWASAAANLLMAERGQMGTRSSPSYIGIYWPHRLTRLERWGPRELLTAYRPKQWNRGLVLAA